AQYAEAPFTGTDAEDYEGTPGGFVSLHTLFDGAADVVGTVQHLSVTQGTWSDFTTGSGSPEILATSGARFGTLASGLEAQIAFDFGGIGGIEAFGGFASDAGDGDTTFELIDLNGNLLGSFTNDLGDRQGNMTPFAIRQADTGAAFSNFPGDGENGGAGGTVGNGGDDFVLPQPAVITGFALNLTTNSGNAPPTAVTIEWAVYELDGTSIGELIEKGSAAGLRGFNYRTDTTFNTYDVAFDIDPIALDAGSYYFATRRNVTAGNANAFWGTVPLPIQGIRPWSGGSPRPFFDELANTTAVTNFSRSDFAFEVRTVEDRQTLIGSVRISGPETAFDDLEIIRTSPIEEDIFIADMTDDYEGFGGAFDTITSMFGGSVAVSGPTEHVSLSVGDWRDSSSDAMPIGVDIQATSGTRFGTIAEFDNPAAIGTIVLDFSDANPAAGGVFGFAGNGSDAADGDTTFRFLNANGFEIGNVTQDLGDREGNMTPFSFTSSAPVAMVEITGPQTALDDLSLLASPAVLPGRVEPNLMEDFEGFDSSANSAQLSMVFGGRVPVTTNVASLTARTFGLWSDLRNPGGPMRPTSGKQFAVLFGTDTTATLDFTALGGITGFTAAGSDAFEVSPTTFAFFDVNGNPLNTYTKTLGPGDGSLECFGFRTADGSTLIGRVDVSGSRTALDDIGITLPTSPCSAADLTAPLGTIDAADVSAFQALFDDADAAADLQPDRQLDYYDIVAQLDLVADGCP
ncbi:MAG: hypothetical protein AAF747_05675, partial [Planctomycetota bacterium]